MSITSTTRIAAAVAAAMLMSVSAFAADAAPAQAPVDEEAAQALARREDCFKCHAVDKKKDGPAYKSVAAKYKNKPDAEEKLVKHLTTGPIVKTAMGDEDEHRIPKTKDEKELLNLIRWILSR
jgi:cytochrome c